MSTWLVSADDDLVIEVRRSDAPALGDPKEEFTRQAIPVAGGMLDLDVARPDLGLSAHISETSTAAWWLPFVFGEAVANAVVAAGPGTETTVEAEPGELAGLAERLLTGYWLRRWWPSGRAGIPAVQEWLLDAELGSLALQAELLFSSEEPARDLLEDHIVVLAREFDRYLSTAVGDGELDAVGTVLLAAVQAAIETVPATAPGYDELLDVEATHLETEAAVAAAELSLGELMDRLASWAVDSLEESEVLVPSGSRELGEALGGEPAQRGGSAELDWAEVHPRSVSTDQARWTLAGDTVRVEFDTEAGSIPSADAEFFARVRFGGESWAVPLTPTPFGFAGERSIAGVGDAADVEVSVYSDRFSLGGRSAASSDLVARRRAHVIDVVRKRVWAATMDPTAQPFAFELRAIAGA